MGHHHPGGNMNIWYTFRTEKGPFNYASYVLRHEDHELGTRTEVASFERHPDRHRAYRYAKHMAAVLGRNANRRA
jgi:hypothetical protein